MTNVIQYIYVYFHFIYIQITIHLSFQSCNFICNKSFKHKSCISQFSFHFAFKRIESMLSVHMITNHWHGPAGLQVGIKESFITQYGPVRLLTGY